MYVHYLRQHLQKRAHLPDGREPSSPLLVSGQHSVSGVHFEETLSVRTFTQGQRVPVQYSGSANVGTHITSTSEDEGKLEQTPPNTEKTASLYPSSISMQQSVDVEPKMLPDVSTSMHTSGDCTPQQRHSAYGNSAQQQHCDNEYVLSTKGEWNLQQGIDTPSVNTIDDLFTSQSSTSANDAGTPQSSPT